MAQSHAVLLSPGLVICVYPEPRGMQSCGLQLSRFLPLLLPIRDPVLCPPRGGMGQLGHGLSLPQLWDFARIPAGAYPSSPSRVKQIQGRALSVLHALALAGGCEGSSHGHGFPSTRAFLLLHRDCSPGALPSLGLLQEVLMAQLHHLLSRSMPGSAAVLSKHGISWGLAASSRTLSIVRDTSTLLLHCNPLTRLAVLSWPCRVETSSSDLAVFSSKAGI